LLRAKYHAARVAKELDILLTKPEHTTKAQQTGKLLRRENGAAVAADLIEEVLEGNDGAIAPGEEEPVYAACD
jgi:UDP:flavonoid glycosyltransferase YjiC (YdhE family)